MSANVNCNNKKNSFNKISNGNVIRSPLCAKDKTHVACSVRLVSHTTVALFVESAPWSNVFSLAHCAPFYHISLKLRSQ